MAAVASPGETAAISEPTTETQDRWLGPGVAGIGTASFLADVGHGIPTALLPNLLTATFGAPAAAPKRSAATPPPRSSPA